MYLCTDFSGQALPELHFDCILKPDELEATLPEAEPRAGCGFKSRGRHGRLAWAPERIGYRADSPSVVTPRTVPVPLFATVIDPIRGTRG